LSKVCDEVCSYGGESVAVVFVPFQQGFLVEEYGGADACIVLVVYGAKQSVDVEDAQQSGEIRNVLVVCRRAALCDGSCLACNVKEDSRSVRDSPSLRAFFFWEKFYQIFNFELSRDHFDNEGFGEPRDLICKDFLGGFTVCSSGVRRGHRDGTWNRWFPFVGEGVGETLEVFRQTVESFMGLLVGVGQIVKTFMGLVVGVCEKYDLVDKFGK